MIITVRTRSRYRRKHRTEQVLSIESVFLTVQAVLFVRAWTFIFNYSTTIHKVTKIHSVLSCATSFHSKITHRINWRVRHELLYKSADCDQWVCQCILLVAVIACICVSKLTKGLGMLFWQWIRGNRFHRSASQNTVYGTEKGCCVLEFERIVDQRFAVNDVSPTRIVEWLGSNLLCARAAFVYHCIKMRSPANLMEE